MIRKIGAVIVGILIVLGWTSAILKSVSPPLPAQREVHRLGNERKVTVITAPAPPRLTISLKRSDGGCGTYADVSSAVRDFDLAGRPVEYVENEEFEEGCLVRATFIFREES